MNRTIDPCDTMRNNLIAAALGLQQCTQTDGTEVLIPGTGKRILIGGDAYLAQMVAPASTQALYVECRECSHCLHVGINDASTTLAACHTCEWSGPSPVEDVCPGCADGNCMGAACPKCGSLYRPLAERDLASPGATTVSAIHQGCCDRAAQAAQAGAPVDALSDDDLWHIAGIVNGLAGGSLLNVSQYDCITAIRSGFMDPDSGREYEKARAAALEGTVS